MKVTPKNLKKRLLLVLTRTYVLNGKYFKISQEKLTNDLNDLLNLKWKARKNILRATYYLFND
jgi:hypothetical protein